MMASPRTSQIEKKTFDHQESVVLKPVFLFAANSAPKKKKKKKCPCYLYKGFVFEKMIPSRHISKKKCLNLPYLDYRFQQVAIPRQES
jgi:hypothetical protein